MILLKYVYNIRSLERTKTVQLNNVQLNKVQLLIRDVV